MKNTVKKTILALALVLILNILSGCSFFAITNVYDVTFEVDGTQVSTQRASNKNEIVLPLTEPEKEGYIFDCWVVKGTTTSFESLNELSANTIFEAKFLAIINYNITYNLEGGSVNGENITTYNAATKATLKNPTKPDYDFAGWITNYDSTPKLTFIFNKTSLGDLILTATWEEKKYNLKFDTVGGSSISTGKYTYNTSVVAPDNPTKNGYEFDGWYSDANYANEFSFPYSMQKKDITIYAKWKIIIYQITYDNAGGKASDTYTIESGFNVPNIAIDGYEFVGWTGNGIKTPVKNYTIPVGTFGDIVLSAKWHILNFTITFNTNGGSQILPLTAEYKSSINAPTPPQKEENVFEGWFLEPSCINEFTFTTMPSRNFTLYAKWTGDYNKTLTYNKDIGSAEIISDRASGSLVTRGEKITLKADSYKNGYIFKGWFEGNEIVSSSPSYTFIMPAKNYNLTAKYLACEVVNNDRTTNVTFSSATGANSIWGENITASDYSVSANGIITLKNEYVNTLKNGEHTFLINFTDGVNTKSDVFEYAFLILSGEEPEFNKQPSTSANRKFYNNTFTYGGETYDFVIENENEFTILMQYVALVKTPCDASYNLLSGKTEYTEQFWIDDSYLTIFGSKVTDTFKTAFAKFSVPYGLSYSILNYNNNQYGITVTPTSNYNTLTSEQTKVVLNDEMWLIPNSNRDSSFNNFYIDNQTKTQVIRSIYELEQLPVGVKPIFESDSDAKTLYLEAKRILRTYVSDEMSDYEKVKVMYDYLGIFVTYDNWILSNAGGVGQTPFGSYASFTAYGALINKVAVCDGYSSALKIMCIIEGINCIEVSGLNEHENTSSGHAWNKVFIDGFCYLVDPTWARQGNVVIHDYLFMNEVKGIKTEHFENDFLTNAFIENISCSQFDYYSLTIVSKGIDLSIASTSELSTLIAYMKSANITKIEINYTFNLSSFALNSACVSNGVSRGSYITINNSICIFEIII